MVFAILEKNKSYYFIIINFLLVVWITKDEKTKGKREKKIAIHTFNHFDEIGEVVLLNIFLMRQTKAIKSCSMIKYIIEAVLARTRALPNKP